MRGKLAAVVIVSVAISALWGLEPGQSRIEAKNWLRYTLTRSGGETQRAGFSIARGYFGFTHQFTAKIKCTFTLDFSSSDNPSDAHGVAVKIKKAFLQVKDFPLVGLSFEGGIVKNYFGLIYDWKYATIQKAPEDVARVCASADAGIALSGKFPGKFGKFQIVMLNGEGYSKFGSEIDKFPLGGVNLRFSPAEFITIGGSAQYTRTTADSSTVDLLRSAGAGIISVKPVKIFAEYFLKKMGDNTGAGFSAMPTINITENLMLVARFDLWDPSDKITDDEQKMFILGANWEFSHSPAGVSKVQAEWEHKTTGGGDPTDELRLQLRWEFKSNPF